MNIGDNMKIAFFGTDQFAARLLKKLEGTNLEPTLVITKPDPKANRGQEVCRVPVKKIALGQEIPFYQPKDLNGKTFLDKYKDKDLDLALICDFGKIVPRDILTVPKIGTLGVHPSLLPKLRGPTPIQTAILQRLDKTGVSVYIVDSKIDHGPILDKKELKLNRPYFEELSRQLTIKAFRLLKNIIPEWKEADILAKPQSDRQASFTEQFSKEDGKINWDKNKKKIEAKIRALSKCLGTYTFFEYKNEKKRLNILRASIPKIVLRKNQKQAAAGTIFSINGRFIVKTKKGCLELDKVQPESKDKMSGKDFLNGYQEVQRLE